jgi:hypothetical protein
MTKGWEEFLVFAKDNPPVMAEVMALKDKPYQEVTAGFVKIGATHGYTMDVDDVEGFLEEAAAHNALKRGDELSDEQLEAVAGGKGGGGGRAAGEVLEAAFQQIGKAFEGLFGGG